MLSLPAPACIASTRVPASSPRARPPAACSNVLPASCASARPRKTTRWQLQRARDPHRRRRAVAADARANAAVGRCARHGPVKRERGLLFSGPEAVPPAAPASCDARDLMDTKMPLHCWPSKLHRPLRPPSAAPATQSSRRPWPGPGICFAPNVCICMAQRCFLLSHWSHRSREWATWPHACNSCEVHAPVAHGSGVAAPKGTSRQPHTRAERHVTCTANRRLQCGGRVAAQARLPPLTAPHGASLRPEAFRTRWLSSQGLRRDGSRSTQNAFSIACACAALALGRLNAGAAAACGGRYGAATRAARRGAASPGRRDTEPALPKSLL